MKKILKGSIFILALMLCNLTWAQSNSSVPSQGTQDWTLVETQKNVGISFSKISVNGTYYLAIQLENKSENAISLIWSVSKDGASLVSETPNTLQVGSSITLFDATRLIPIGEHESYDAYRVQIR